MTKYAKVFKSLKEMILKGKCILVQKIRCDICIREIFQKFMNIRILENLR